MERNMDHSLKTDVSHLSRLIEFTSLFSLRFRLMLLSLLLLPTLSFTHIRLHFTPNPLYNSTYTPSIVPLWEKRRNGSWNNR
ncbi:hypothetical protein N657DRAFT_30723 [Parathielavia appendiculata]|uniref:Uncharacterized protein n=1 Tax=Parathielavia appendiculata TaxID=2587402 RepID=A0AAN6Z8J6_9PEZI|nr:hypothetical protein N657DRAFT_30723 [Parathielavia appendiculata]